MCGIVGIISKQNGGFYGNTDDIFEELLYVDGLRGMDSTGAFSVDKKNKVNVVKQAANPGIFLQTQTWKQFKGNILTQSRILIGHNRKATVGEIVSRNAHPFVGELEKDGKNKVITLVHNGYISNYKQFDEKAEVDSQAVASALCKEDDPLKVLSELYGMFALVWYDHSKKKLFAARNKDRPLHMYHTVDYLFIASEADSLKWILEREGRNAKANPVTFSEDRLYEFSLNPFTTKVTDIPKKSMWKPLPDSSVYRPNSYPADLLDPMGGANDDDHPLPELERMRRAAEQGTGDSLEDDVQALRKMYPQRSQVLFRVTGMIPEKILTVDGKTMDHFKVNGYCWTPGNPMRRAKVTVPDDKVDMIINPEQPLLGTVNCVMRRDAEMWVVLQGLQQQSATDKDVQGRVFGVEEWNMIMKNIGCDECAKPIRPHQGLEFTSITRSATAQYSVICANCLFDSAAPKKGGANGG